MSGKTKFFLDTNIFVYTFDDRAPEKRSKARFLVETALRNQTGITSFQVIQEFLNVATGKFEKPLSRGDCSLYLDRVLSPLCDIHSSPMLYESALDVQERWKFSFFDSLIVAAALSGSCGILYSEDLQHGQKIRELTIENPFLA